MGLSRGQWGSVEIIGGQLEVSGGHWGSVEIIGAHWRSLGISGGHWGSVGFSGSLWGPVGVTGAQCAMYIRTARTACREADQKEPKDKMNKILDLSSAGFKAKENT